MTERRKILIPTGVEDEGGLETPHFDTEAARAAKPVVPLTAQTDDLGPLTPLPQSVHYTQSEPVPRARISPWLVALVIAAAMSVGAAGALALDYYRNHKHDETQAAIQSSDAAVPDAHATDVPLVENRQAELPATDTNARRAEPSAEPEVSVSEPKTPTAEVVISNEKSQTPVAARPKSTEMTPPERAGAREERKADEKERPADAREARRERQREATNEEGTDDADARARARRQRHPRDIEVRPDDIPPQIRQRANQELHRIREIFEGSRP